MNIGFNAKMQKEYGSTPIAISQAMTKSTGLDHTIGCCIASERNGRQIIDLYDHREKITQYTYVISSSKSITEQKKK